MVFWLILLGMTLATLAFLALPFLARARDERRGDDVAVYRDQLAEIDRDSAPAGSWRKRPRPPASRSRAAC